MQEHTIIIGGGIGGLTAALALSKVSQPAILLERNPHFSEMGAGLQLSPNAVRHLKQLNLLNPIMQLANMPNHLLVRNANKGDILGQMPLGDTVLNRYGSPYLTMHRADLHRILLNAVSQTSTVLYTNTHVIDYQLSINGIILTINNSPIQYSGHCLIGADGLYSQIRQWMLNDGYPKLSGHTVYRGLIKQIDLPISLRSQEITVWLAPKLHVVVYPIRANELLNIVVVMHGKVQLNQNNWENFAHKPLILNKIRAISCIHSALLHLIEALCSKDSPCDWRVWNVYDREPISNPMQMAQGDKRMVLLGDAAHPMRPYLAQGAAMAIEDAIAFANAISVYGKDNIPLVCNQYAINRWKRCAQVQIRSRRNGYIFHTTGLIRWIRDLGLKYIGQRLLTIPWLYGG